MKAKYDLLDPKTRTLLCICLGREQPEEIEETCGLSYQLLDRAGRNQPIMDWAVELITEAMDTYKFNILDQAFW